MHKSVKRILISVLLSVMMIIQICNVYAADATVSVPYQDMMIEDKVLVPVGTSKIKEAVMLSEETSESEASTTLTESNNTPELVAIVVNGKNYGIQEYSNNIILTTVVTELGYYDKNSVLEPTKDENNNNFIQPQGITNISDEITFNAKSKEVSYTVDISNLVNETIKDDKLMHYKLDKAIVQIIHANGSGPLIRGTDYTVQPIVGNEMVICFNQEFIEKDAKYRIAIYIPTTMDDKVVYGGGTENTYLKKYINSEDTTTAAIKGDVKAIIKAMPKVDEVAFEQGRSVEVYSSVPFLTEYTLSLKYLEIAKIN